MLEQKPDPVELGGMDAPGETITKRDKTSSEKAADRRRKEIDNRADARADSETKLLRWIKLSLTLASTGVGLISALKYLEGTGPGRLDPYSVLRVVGVALVILGVGAAWASCVEHWRTLQRIASGDPPPEPRLTLALVVGVTIAVLSVIALLAALTARGQ